MKFEPEEEKALEKKREFKNLKKIQKLDKE
jgi:hypothetical protein